VLNLAGQDASESYDEIHTADLVEETLGSNAIVGRVDATTIPKLDEKKDVQQDSLKAPPLRNMINLDDFEQLAERFMKPTTCESEIRAYSKSSQYLRSHI